MLTESIERPLPHNVDAERSVLGAIVLDNQSLQVAADRLRAEDFFLPQNRLIYQCMLQLSEKSQPIEPLTMGEHLERLGQLESAGGIAYLSELADGLPRVSNVEHYARIVRDKALLRNLIHSAAAIQEEAFAANDDADKILANSGGKIAALCARTGLGIEPAAWMDVFHSWEEFENCPPLSFAIEGFLQNDGATMIGGLSGHGKTLMLCSIVRALLAGKGARLWDLFPVKENTVRIVYLIPECALAPFKHRLKLFGIYDALGPNDGRLLVRTLSKGATPSLSDPRILFAVKGAHVFLDTASRFGEGEENSANDNSKGLANDIFSLLNSGARSVVAAHHSPKAFSRENTMRLENCLRGSGDVGAMLSTAWGVKRIDEASTILHLENLKPRDFQPCGPFQIIGKPYIDDEGDFRLHKRPGECGHLMDEEQPERPKGGAPTLVREGRAANLALLRTWLGDDPGITSEELVRRFKNAGVEVASSTVRKYKMELGK
jgi:DnaB-like helicase N terminal domain/AAA domain